MQVKLTKQHKIEKHKSKLDNISPKDRVLYNLVLFLLEQGQSYEVIEGRYLQGQSGANKSKKKKKLRKIYNTYIKNTIK